jgi:hypothetical protein
MGMDFVLEFPEQCSKLARIAEELTVSGPSPAAQDVANREEMRPYAQAALQHLQEAQQDLKRAPHNEGVHCARALQLTENAITELTKAWKLKSNVGAINPDSGRNAAPPREECFDLIS